MEKKGFTKLNNMLEYVHNADGRPYPTSSAEADAFLNNTGYFPDGDPRGNYNIGYNNERKYFYCMRPYYRPPPRPRFR